LLPNLPTLFFRAGIENLCEHVAAQVVDAPASQGSVHWSSSDPRTAIAGFVSQVMALPASDPRAEAARQLLVEHFASASAQPGITATQALQSTFVVACLSPSTVSVGL
jgi:hypothetical protein